MWAHPSSPFAKEVKKWKPLQRLGRKTQATVSSASTTVHPTDIWSGDFGHGISCRAAQHLVFWDAPTINLVGVIGLRARWLTEADCGRRNSQKWPGSRCIGTSGLTGARPFPATLRVRYSYQRSPTRENRLRTSPLEKAQGETGKRRKCRTSFGYGESSDTAGDQQGLARVGRLSRHRGVHSKGSLIHRLPSSIIDPSPVRSGRHPLSQHQLRQWPNLPTLLISKQKHFMAVDSI
jgi:hypothetical protein